MRTYCTRFWTNRARFMGKKTSRAFTRSCQSVIQSQQYWSCRQDTDVRTLLILFARVDVLWTRMKTSRVFTINNKIDFHAVMFNEDKTLAAIGQPLDLTASFLRKLWFTNVYICERRVDWVSRASLFASGSVCPTPPIHHSSRSSQGGRWKVQNLPVCLLFVSNLHLHPLIKSYCNSHSQNDNFISDLATSGVLPFPITVAIISYIKLLIGGICCVVGRFLLKNHLLGA